MPADICDKDDVLGASFKNVRLSLAGPSTSHEVYNRSFPNLGVVNLPRIDRSTSYSIDGTFVETTMQ